MQAIAAGEVIRVPSRTYPTIQSALTQAHDGDVIIVKPGVYSGSANRNMDFGGKSVILQSEINPGNPDWDTIANTIIDCGGRPAHVILGDNGAANRAFWFHSGEGPNTVVMGFTIRNGYARGHKGKDGTPGLPLPYPPYTPPMHNGQNACFDSSNPEDTNGPPIADYGHHSPSNARGFGGGILCGRDQRNQAGDLGSSPTIKYCIIEDCTVTGGEGGRGANGWSGPWLWWPCMAYTDEWGYLDLAIDPSLDPNQEYEPVLSLDGQWGGRGGNGLGIGMGAAIACNTASSPVITDCIFRNNRARGGVGGDGGSGGSALTLDFGLTWEGLESGGGDGGQGRGEGWGGVICAGGGSNPIVVNCTFDENAATSGLGGEGGARGPGNEADPRPPVGIDGMAYSDAGYGHISGGVGYYNQGTTANFTNCTFTNNAAYEASILYQILEVYYGLTGVVPEEIYTVGGALYFHSNNTVNLNNCDFIDNLGGAIYLSSNCDVNISNDYDSSRQCLFSGNSDPNEGADLWWDRGVDFSAGGALYIGNDCTVNLRGCNFTNNSVKNEGGALKCKGRSVVSLQDCSFSGNTAATYGGAIDLYDNGVSMTMDANRSNFIGNRALYGGALCGEVFDATFTDCYLTNNVAEEGGALDVVYGNVQIEGGGIITNRARTDDGGGICCQDTDLAILHSVIRSNSANGPNSKGGAIDFEGRASHLVKNCLIVDNSAGGSGGAIHCDGATPEIENCTFDGDIAGGYGGAVFADWGSLPQLTRSIITRCNNHAIHEEDPGGDAVVTETLFYNNPDGEYYDSGTHLTYAGPSHVGSIPGGSDNIYGNPLFVSGNLGAYYLSQLDANDPAESPAVDAGSVTAASVGLDTVTTHRFNKPDADEVDLGYHYPAIGVPEFSLTLSVIGGNGTVQASSPEPVSYDANTGIYRYYAGTIVTLTATPEYGWGVKAWYGTDNDSSTLLDRQYKYRNYELQQGR